MRIETVEEIIKPVEHESGFEPEPGTTEEPKKVVEQEPGFEPELEERNQDFQESEFEEPAPEKKPINEWADARQTLETYLEFKASNFAQSLLDFLNEKGFLSPVQMEYVLGTLVNGARTNKNPKGKPCFKAEMAKPLTDDKKFKQRIKAPIDLSQYPVEQTFTTLPPRANPSECYETAKFPYMSFPFKYFNPVQTNFLPEVGTDNNVVISAATSAGKTALAETITGYTLNETRKKDPFAIIGYIAPLKALCKEKEETWTDKKHPFYNCNISILTGDYTLTDSRKEELEAADIICMSAEMLGSRIRRNEAEQNQFLNNLSVLVVDESHLVGQADRGPNLEAALIKFTKVNKKCRIIFLSATMPNVSELGTWLTMLNGKQTTIIESSYRPVELKIHFEQYIYAGREHETAMLIQEATSLIRRYPKDKFILFVHAKKIGWNLTKQLKTFSENVEFHCADLEKADRERVEKEFRDRSPKALRIVVATSTLAWGLNFPARRVGILGATRGGIPVEPLEIIQECGRAGRVGIDTEGDAHIILSNQYSLKAREDLLIARPIESKMADLDTLAFHLVSEIVDGVNTKTGILRWFKRTLLYHQNPDHDNAITLLEKTIERLAAAKAIKINNDGKEVFLETTTIGRISSWFYYSPFTIASWCFNFRNIFEKQQPSDSEIAWALANSYETSKEYPLVLDERAKALTKKLQDSGLPLAEGSKKHHYALWMCLNGIHTDILEMKSICRKWQFDAERVCTALRALNDIGKYYERLPGQSTLYELSPRLKYGVPANIVELVLLPGIGSVKAQALANTHKIHTCQDYVAAVRMGKRIFSEDLAKKVLPIAEEIARVGKLTYLKKLKGK